MKYIHEEGVERSGKKNLWKTKQLIGECSNTLEYLKVDNSFSEWWFIHVSRVWSGLLDVFSLREASDLTKTLKSLIKIDSS